jgi:uncharacterized membrane protein YbhN (UPF0104 family)
MDDTSTLTKLRRWAWPVCKWGLFALVMWYVGQQGWKLWTTPHDPVRIDFVWLVPAAIFYLLGWLPSVWFWRAMLGGFGPKPSWPAVIRAYYIGHLGKYVPGKAMVLVIRAALLRESGCPAGVSAVTAMYETLATMGAGAAIAVALSPLATSPTLWQTLPTWLQPLGQQLVLMPALVLTVTLVSLPVIAKLFTVIAAKMTPKGDTPLSPMTAAATRIGIPVKTLLKGLAVVSVGWCLFALSLGCVLRALGATTTLVAGFPVWLAASTLSTVGGFVILIAPGGLGVREFLLMEVLHSQPNITEAQAFVAAWLLRAVWFLSELLAAAVAWCWPTASPERGASAH